MQTSIHLCSLQKTIQKKRSANDADNLLNSENPPSKKRALITPSSAQAPEPSSSKAGFNVPISCLVLTLTPKSQLSVRKDIDIPLLKVTTMCAGYAVRQYDAFNDRELEHKIQLLELPRLGLQITELNRSKCVERMQYLCWQTRLLQSTLHLGVSIMDRYLDAASRKSGALKSPITTSTLSIICLACINLASKLEENILHPSQVSILSLLLELMKKEKLQPVGLTKDQVSYWENEVSSTLNYDLFSPTIITFLLRYVRAGELTEMETTVASCCCDRAILETQLLKWPPSCVAACCVSLARQCFGHQSWSETLKYYTCYDEEDISQAKGCLQRALQLEERVSAQKSTSIATTVYHKTIKTWYSPFYSHLSRC